MQQVFMLRTPGRKPLVDGGAEPGPMLIIGHRGVAHPLVAENSLAAIELALLEGADGVEVDVRLTVDGVPVCHHDSSLLRTAGDPRQVSRLTYGELSSLGEHRVPLLSEVVDLMDGRGRLVLDLKVPSFPEPGADDTVDAVVALLRRQQPRLVTVSSFDMQRVLQLRRSGLPVRTALLGRPGLPLDLLLLRARQDGHEEVHPHLSSLLARPTLVEPALKDGVSLTAWTVNAPDELRFLAAAGVPAVITDNPGAARLALRPQLVPA
jgi:glycerophosphoryl diester phosphodiesterase